VPEVSFLSLTSHLSDESTRLAVQNTGSVVVRDVVTDGQAKGWAKAIIAALEHRQSRRKSHAACDAPSVVIDETATFWHDSMVAARAHPSVLAANQAVLSAMTGIEGDALVRADSVQNGITSPSSPITALDAPWTVDEKVCCC
jgi:hypothetical protein